MKIDAVAVTTTNMAKTIEFYALLGFHFPDGAEGEDHVEPLVPEGSARLMIDKADLAKSIIGAQPTPGNHSSFAIHMATPKEVNEACAVLSNAGHKIVKKPWDAPWGQRYGIIEDPDGYRIDLYSPLS